MIDNHVEKTNITAMEKAKAVLIRLVGFPATLIHGDTLVLDRWLWLRRRLPRTAGGDCRLLDIGCGTGAFTIGSARRGYCALGLSWDSRNQAVAEYRAALSGAHSARFEVLDVRHLDERLDLRASYDVVVCCEVVEHIINDQKLFQDIARCLNTNGILLLTTPNVDYRAITPDDNGPFCKTETGWHVRRGYSESDLKHLCEGSGLYPVELGYCSGFLSQKATWLLRTLGRIHPLLGWLAILPLRPLIPFFDLFITRWLGWPGFSITLVANRNHQNLVL
jgi:SAM-dependent methyltransferase